MGNISVPQFSPKKELDYLSFLLPANQGCTIEGKKGKNTKPTEVLTFSSFIYWLVRKIISVRIVNAPTNSRITQQSCYFETLIMDVVLTAFLGGTENIDTYRMINSLPNFLPEGTALKHAAKLRT